MTVVAPPELPRVPREDSSPTVDPFEALEAEVRAEVDPLEALIEEARQRTRRRRRRYGAAALIVGVLGLVAIVGLTRAVGSAARATAPDAAPASSARLPAGDIAVTRFGSVSHVVLWSRRGVRDLGIEGTAFGWSPDGTRLLVESGTNGSLWIVDLDGPRETLVSRRANGFDAAWSPDGSKVAVAHGPNGVGFRSLTIVDVRTGESRHIRARVLDGGWLSGNLTWSPDGSKLMFAGRTAAHRREGLFVVRADGNAPPRPFVIHAATVRPSQPAWSPRGSRIAFVNAERPGGVYGGIYTMNPDGTAVRHVAAGHGPIWSPDGTMIAFRGNGNQTVHADGTHRVRLAGGGAWAGLTWSPSGNWLAEVSRISGGTGGDVWLVRSDGTDPMRVIHTPHTYYGFPLWRGGTATTESR